MFSKTLSKLICKIFGHNMFYWNTDISGPSQCKRCGHIEPGVVWSVPPMPSVKPPKDQE